MTSVHSSRDVALIYTIALPALSSSGHETGSCRFHGQLLERAYDACRNCFLTFVDCSIEMGRRDGWIKLVNPAGRIKNTPCLYVCFRVSGWCQQGKQCSGGCCDYSQDCSPHFP
jgi:hypothetical protein